MAKEPATALLFVLNTNSRPLLSTCLVVIFIRNDLLFTAFRVMNVTTKNKKGGTKIMKIRFNVTGSDRKRLVGAISQAINSPTKYLGAPTFAYEVGNYHIDKNGEVTGNDNELLVSELAEQGFSGVAEYENTYQEGETRIGSEHWMSESVESGSETDETPAFENLQMTESEELGLGRTRHDYPGENGMQASDVPEPDSLTIELPLEGFTETALDNLEKLVISKAALIKKSVGASDLPLERTETTLRFPWFSADASSDAIKAYTQLVAALATMAKEQKRITAKERTVDNEKYAFRCFLLRLGFIGEEYAAARKILLAGLSGNGSFRSGERKAPDTVADSGEETTAADRNAAEETSADNADTVEEVAV
jgi:hypothetical protein